MPASKVLVYGATGAQGGPVAAQLLSQGQQVRVVSRFKEKTTSLAARGAEVAIADLAVPSTLAAANEGVDRVVLQLPLQYDFDLHETYGRNAVDAARAAGAELLVMNTSAHVIEGADVRVYKARQEVVDYLQASGVPNIVLRPTFYMEIFLGPWIRPGIVDQGVLAFPLPADFPMSWVSADEMAAYAIAALNRPDLSGRTYDIGGPQALTGTQLAEHFSRAVGKTVTYVSVSPDDYEQSIAPMFGPTVAYEVAAQVRYMISRGDGSVDMSATAAEFSVAPISLDQWISGYPWNGPDTGSVDVRDERGAHAQQDLP